MLILIRLRKALFLHLFTNEYKEIYTYLCNQTQSGIHGNKWVKFNLPSKIRFKLV